MGRESVFRRGQEDFRLVKRGGRKASQECFPSIISIVTDARKAARRAAIDRFLAISSLDLYPAWRAASADGPRVPDVPVVTTIRLAVVPRVHSLLTSPSPRPWSVATEPSNPRERLLVGSRPQPWITFPVTTSTLHSMTSEETYGRKIQSDRADRQTAAPRRRTKLPRESMPPKLASNYINFCRVTGMPEEVIIDFGLSTDPAEMRQAFGDRHRAGHPQLLHGQTPARSAATDRLAARSGFWHAWS